MKNVLCCKRLKVMKPTPPFMVHNAESNFIGTDQGKAEATKAWFQKEFTDQEHDGLNKFIGNARLLQTPVTEEVKAATFHLQNGHSTVPDGSKE